MLNAPVGINEIYRQWARGKKRKKLEVGESVNRWLIKEYPNFWMDL